MECTLSFSCSNSFPGNVLDVMTVYPKAEIVIPPAVTVLLHRTGGWGVAQVMIPTDKHQRDGGISSSQRSLQVTLLLFFIGTAWKEQRS